MGLLAEVNGDLCGGAWGEWDGEVAAAIFGEVFLKVGEGLALLKLSSDDAGGRWQRAVLAICEGGGGEGLELVWVDEGRKAHEAEVLAEVLVRVRGGVVVDVFCWHSISG